MKTTHYDERDLTESLYRHAGPALVWAALLAFFALAGASSRDEPKQVTDVAPSLRLMAHETADVPAMVLNAPSARDSARHAVCFGSQAAVRACHREQGADGPMAGKPSLSGRNPRGNE
jgi:hypothetical protein